MSSSPCLAIVLLINVLLVKAQSTLDPEQECQSSVVKKFSDKLYDTLGQLQTLQKTACTPDLQIIAGNSATTLINALQAAQECSSLDCLDALGAKTLAQFAELNDQICAFETGKQEKLEGEQIKKLNSEASGLINTALKELQECGVTFGNTDEGMGSTASD